jgi:hypothetical protein
LLVSESYLKTCLVPTQGTQASFFNRGLSFPVSPTYAELGHILLLGTRGAKTRVRLTFTFTITRRITPAMTNYDGSSQNIAQ